MLLKVVGTRRVPSSRSRRAMNCPTTNGFFYKSSGTRYLSLSMLMCQIIMHTPQIIITEIGRLWYGFLTAQ